MDKMMAIPKYKNISGKKKINNPTAKMPAIGFMKALNLFNLQFVVNS